MLKDILGKYELDELYKLDDFDSAILGIDGKSMCLIYSISKCIQILIEEGETEEDALVHFYYNIYETYVGEQTRIWCDDYFR
jgi:hypothetical protein